MVEAATQLLCDDRSANADELRAIVEACRLTDMKDRWSRLEQLVDIDDFVRYIALETMVCHWDGYCLNRNNYRIYFEPTKKARFIPHGMDQCFGDTGLSVLDAPHAMVVREPQRVSLPCGQAQEIGRAHV